MDGKTVTVSKESLNQSEVKISGEGYTLKLADNVPTPVTKQFEWSLSDTTAKLSAGTSEGYTLDENTITYTKEISGKTLTSISGLRKGLTVVNGEIEGIKLDNDVITLSNKALSNKVSVSGEGYEFSFAADYGNSSISGSKGDEIIKVLGANITVTGGKGDDTITSSGKGNVFAYSTGDGDDVIADFSTNDKLKISKGTPDISVEGNDVIVKVGNGSITLEDVACQDITILDAKNKSKIYSTIDLLTDENFNPLTTLDNIVENPRANYSPDNFETSSNIENPTTKDTLVTYGADEK